MKYKKLKYNIDIIKKVKEDIIKDITRIEQKFLEVNLLTYSCSMRMYDEVGCDIDKEYIIKQLKNIDLGDIKISNVSIKEEVLMKTDSSKFFDISIQMVIKENEEKPQNILDKIRRLLWK